MADTLDAGQSGPEEDAVSLEELDRTLLSLRPALLQAADSVGAGVPPPVELAEQIRAAAAQFGRARDALVERLSHEAGIEASASDLRDLRRIAQQLREVRDSRRRGDAVRHLLNQVLAVVPSEESDDVTRRAFEPCAAEARDLLATLDAGDAAGPEARAELQKLEDPRHPLRDLIALLDPAAEEDFERLDTLQIAVGNAFGRPLAYAAMRGKIRVAAGAAAATAQIVPESKAAPVPRPPEKPMATARHLGATSPRQAAVSEKATQKKLDQAVRGPAAWMTKALDPAGDTDGGTPVVPAVAVVAKSAAALQSAPPSTSAAAVAVTSADRPVAESEEETFSPASEDAVGSPVAAAPQEPASSDDVPLAAGAVVEDRRPREDAELYWRLLAEDRAGLAALLAEAQERDGQRPAVPSHVARAVAMAPLVNGPTGETVDLLAEVNAGLRAWVESPGDLQDEPALALLAFSALLRPALLAPASDAVGPLDRLPLPGPMQQLHPLRQAVVNFGRMGLGIGPNLLKGVRDHAKWDRQLQDLRAEAAAFLERARHFSTKFHHATSVWRQWAAPGGEVARVLAVVIEDRRKDRGEAERVWARGDAASHFTDELIHLTDGQIRKRRKFEAIIGTPLEDIRRHAADALGYVGQWLDLLRAEPQSQRDYQYRTATECRETVIGQWATLEAVVEQVEKFEGESRVAASRRLFDDLEHLLDPDQTVGRAPPPRLILAQDLLFLPAPRLDDQFAVAARDDSEAWTAELRRLAGEPRPPWERALDLHLGDESRLGNHWLARQILDHLAYQGADPAEVQRMREERELKLSRDRAALEHQVREARKAVEAARAKELVSSDELEAFLEQINAIDAASVEDTHRAELRLQEIEADLHGRRAREIESVRERMREMRSGRDAAERSDAFGRAAVALDEQNVVAATEILDLIGQGLKVPEPHRQGEAFFPDFVGEWERFMAGKRPNAEHLADIGKGRKVGPVDVRKLSGEEARAAKSMLQIWMEMPSGNRDKDVERVRQLLVDLGFAVQSVEPDGQAPMNCRVFEVQTDPISRRETCVIPQAGSLADGRYRVICLLHPPNIEQVLELTERRKDRATLVLYFGRLGLAQRRELAFRLERRLALVVDEALVFYLAARPAKRLSSLFASTFPFVTADPYTTSAGRLPPEMFFGRGRERDQLLDPLGTSLVYGGRQLGKTALLLHVEREHAGREDFVVRYVDLKNERIGYERGPEDVWPAVAAALESAGVTARNARKRETVQQRIVQWLGGNVGRRVLVLLDESDEFLARDSASDYRVVTELRSLMQETGGRFKAVFAGLHNVQRTSRLRNSSLAHLGDPICIGPLNGEDLNDARDLITLPLEALGYRLPENLPLLILSHTNYYPSLIQIFCKELLSFLTKNRASLFGRAKSPPYEITEKQVEDVYLREGLQQQILDRFRWTLNLDLRYKVIALVIALETVRRRSADEPVTAFNSQWAADEAVYWWPTGFNDARDAESVAALLDEMVGLGVLRKSEGGYLLRSSNVANLLGSAEKIERELLDATAAPPAPAFDPTRARRRHRDDPWRRSPLTGDQEGRLLEPANGVDVLLGSRLAGIGEVEPFLNIACDDREAEFELLGGPAINFAARLADAFSTRTAEVKVVLVPAEVDWDAGWVHDAARVVGRLQSVTSFARVLFVGDAACAWRAVAAAADALPTSPPGRAGHPIRLFPGRRLHLLKPWGAEAMGQWRRETEIGPSGQAEGDHFIRDLPHWAGPMHELGRRCGHDPLCGEAEATKLTALLRNPTGPWAADLFDPPAEVLKLIDDLGGAGDDDLAELADPGLAVLVPAALRWCDLMHFTRLDTEGQRHVDPTVKELLAARHGSRDAGGA